LKQFHSEENMYILQRKGKEFSTMSIN